MPRKSAEAIAAARFLASPSGRHPSPPADMPEAAKRVWKDIVECRPVDFFRGGSLQLLEQFCRQTVIARQMTAAVEADPTDRDAVGSMTKVSASLTTLATKLRLSIQAENGRHGLDRAEGKLNEAAPKASSLLGGHAMPGVETRNRH